MVGAVTVLIAVVAVFLAYNANNGLPFVPVYRVSVEIPNAARLTNNNEVRIGGHRVGVVESIEPMQTGSEQTLADSDGALAAEEADDTGGVGALVNLKLDKTAEPLPQDSIFRVRYRSAFGLKYLEVVRGNGEGAPEGFTFDGTDDGGVCSLPATADEPPAAGAAGNGCFQEQTEFDDIANTFDTETRENSRKNLTGFGDAFAGRGFSLNQTIANLRPLIVNLKPVSDMLVEPTTKLIRFFPELADAARIVAPVAEEQAELFTFMAVTFTAISSDVEALKETISEGVPTLRTGIETLPRQVPFLHDFATLARTLRPGVADLRITLPTLNGAIDVGTPVLNRSVSMNVRLRGVFQELLQLVDQETTRIALDRLGETFDIAKPLARYVVPSQTNCNYWNYWFTNVPNGLSDPDSIGYTFRQALTSYPPGPETFNFPAPLGTQSVPGEAQTPMAGYSGIQANGKVGGSMPPDGSVSYSSGEFAPYALPITYGPVYGPAGQNFPNRGDFDDCQSGQTGYPLGRLKLEGQANKNPAIGVADLPGSRGPTTLFWNQDSTRELRDTRVASRQPQTWSNLP
ncbi:MAG: MlaD family protein [Solirubrobacterales bacterium]